MLYNLLAHLDSLFLPQIWKMEDIVENEGEDYREYKDESKKLIAAAASTACSIKAVLDTPILTEKGEFVLFIEGSNKELDFSDMSIVEHVKMYMDEGNEEKDAIKLVAKDRGVKKSDIYKEYHLRK